MQTIWEKIGHGRYALNANGQPLQVMYSPDQDSDDKRPYIAIVERKPLPRRYWTLREAKTGAMDAAGLNGQARADKVREQADKTDTAMSQAMQAAAAARATKDTNGQPSASELLDRAFAELSPKLPPAQQEPAPPVRKPEPAPEPAPEPSVAAEPEIAADDAVSRVTTDLPRDLAAPDAAAVIAKAQADMGHVQEILTLLSQAQAAAQLLSELGVPCRLVLPAEIDLCSH